jgi:NAD(P)-dependent dehydrogenase (short-subunit alcohol dehydrogenase family)
MGSSVKGRRVALVSGGTRSIGAAISERLVYDGIEVAAVYRSDDSAAKALQKRLLADGVDWFVPYKVDLSDSAAAGQVVDAILDRHGRIDYLVNNAGILRDARIRDMSVVDWDEVIRVDLSAVFYVTQPVLRAMVEQKFGRIVMIGSVAGFHGHDLAGELFGGQGGTLWAGSLDRP